MNKPSMPPGPVSGTGVWYGRDLQGRSDWIREFAAAELAELDAAVRAFKVSGTPLDGGDGAKIVDVATIELTDARAAEVLLFDLP